MSNDKYLFNIIRSFSEHAVLIRRSKSMQC